MNTPKVDILLVEDNPNDVELTLLAFKKNQMTNNIRVASDGIEALDCLIGTNSTQLIIPKLILLDLKLPKMDGIEVLRRIKAHPGTKMIPVVVLTSSLEDQDVCECYSLGVNSYIVKPVDFEKFVEVVRTLGLYWLLLNQQPTLSK
jgi:two-component system, response regulator